MTGFEKYSDKVLLQVQANLLQGLDKVSTALSDGSFHTLGSKGEASPSQSGHTTIGFLAMVSLELAKRGLPSVAVSLNNVMEEVQSEL